MTVQQLIDELNKINNKKATVTIEYEDSQYGYDTIDNIAVVTYSGVNTVYITHKDLA